MVDGGGVSEVVVVAGSVVAGATVVGTVVTGAVVVGSAPAVHAAANSASAKTRATDREVNIMQRKISHEETHANFDFSPSVLRDRT